MLTNTKETPGSPVNTALRHLSRTSTAPPSTRPAIGGHTWELPAGTIDRGENPADAARRELLEETGLHADTLEYLGAYHPDTGRLDVRSHAFFARASRAEAPPPLEPGLEVRFVSIAELRQMIRQHEFAHQIHLGVYVAALGLGAS